jgi:alcohol dehydrogenase class IV
MHTIKQKARALLQEFKGGDYLFGLNTIGRIGEATRSIGKHVSIVADGLGQNWATPLHEDVVKLFKASGIRMAGELIRGADPNAPKEDLFRISRTLGEQNPDAVISIGGGSTIDCTKAAIAYLVLGKKYPDINDYFGMGQVTAMLEEEGAMMIPHLAVMVAASSAAHLTKYSNITDISTGQKMLIVDERVVPQKALFDYSYTASQPHNLTVDGGLDGIAHSLEVWMGIPDEKQAKTEPVCLTGIELIVKNIKDAVENPQNMETREAIGLGTDLGGYAIMIGGTNGAHLNSFSMTDILSHGRACALMNPYYVVFFSTVIEDKLRKIGQIYHKAGYLDMDPGALSGRDLGEQVARAMITLSGEIGFPTTLQEVEGFSEEHIEKCLEAAKNPKLDSKLKNMPVPLSAGTIDEFMGSVLQAAKVGDLGLVKNM